MLSVCLVSMTQTGFEKSSRCSARTDVHASKTRRGKLGPAQHVVVKESVQVDSENLMAGTTILKSLESNQARRLCALDPHESMVVAWEACAYLEKEREVLSIPAGLVIIEALLLCESGV